MGLRFTQYQAEEKNVFKSMDVALRLAFCINNNILVRVAKEHCKEEKYESIWRTQRM